MCWTINIFFLFYIEAAINSAFEQLRFFSTLFGCVCFVIFMAEIEIPIIIFFATWNQRKFIKNMRTLWYKKNIIWFILFASSFVQNKHRLKILREYRMSVKKIVDFYFEIRNYFVKKGFAQFLLTLLKLVL